MLCSRGGGACVVRDMCAVQLAGWPGPMALPKNCEE